MAEKTENNAITNEEEKGKGLFQKVGTTLDNGVNVVKKNWKPIIGGIAGSLFGATTMFVLLNKRQEEVLVEEENEYVEED